MDQESLSEKGAYRNSLMTRSANQPERNPVVITVWSDGFGSQARFEPTQGFIQRYVAIPFPWAFTHDEERGVVLTNQYGKRLSAKDVYQYARDQKDGFRLNHATG